MSTNTLGSGNSAFGRSALTSNDNNPQCTFAGHPDCGDENSAFGAFALALNATGDENSAFGHRALYTNQDGSYNSAFGERALEDNTGGVSNVAIGSGALLNNTQGDSNVAVGRSALSSNSTGNRNVGIGAGALTLNTGSDNVMLGWSAGSHHLGSNGILIGSANLCDNSEVCYGTNNNTIIIGNDAHTRTLIYGIEGFFGPGSGMPVLISGNELHTEMSSGRFKEAVRDMGEESSVLMELRPVTFRYRPEVREGSTQREYGLIAEEVAEVAPSLIVTDDDGRPHSVRYHVLPTLLLNELQRQEHKIETLLARVEELESARPAVAPAQIQP
jgi:hypothetical protein